MQKRSEGLFVLQFSETHYTFHLDQKNGENNEYLRHWDRLCGVGDRRLFS